MNDVLARGASMSEDGRYRYRLWRQLPDPILNLPDAFWSRGTVCFIMLNPSTADAEIDDPTIRRCIGFAKRWSFERLEVVNLFAYRATRPRDLWNAFSHGADIVGPENDEAIATAIHSSDRVVAAWGAIPPAHLVLGRVWYISSLTPLMALGTTRAGDPRHPLFVRSDAKLQPWEKR